MTLLGITLVAFGYVLNRYIGALAVRRLLLEPVGYFVTAVLVLSGVVIILDQACGLN